MCARKILVQSAAPPARLIRVLRGRSTFTLLTCMLALRVARMCVLFVPHHLVSSVARTQLSRTHHVSHIGSSVVIHIASFAVPVAISTQDFPDLWHPPCSLPCTRDPLLLQF